jgi:IrrE N-terminal-like domain
VGAAQTAADRLLKRYFSNNALDNDSISVASLCDLLGIEIRGKLPRIPRRGVRSHLTQLSTHTAKLSFESNRPVIEVMDSIAPRARVSAAHELGHYLIHLRDGELDYSTLCAGSTPEEEVLSEYIGRLLLMPLNQFQTHFKQANGYSLACLTAASKAVVSMHASAARIGDPDRPQTNRMRGTIFWRLHPTKTQSLSIEERLTPNWHLCPGAFIPIRKCQARKGSIIATLASSDEDVQGVAEEDVEIGTLRGRFQVDAFAWGSLRRGTRCVLSIFINPD